MAIVHRDSSTILMDKLKSLGLFNLQEARQSGVSQSTISRFSESGEILKLGSGFYIHPEAQYDPSTLDLAISCKKFGQRAIIGGLSALYFYRLIDEVPDRIWVIVPPEKRTTEKIYRLIRSKNIPNTDIDEMDNFRVGTMERTLIESLRYGSKIGIQTAISATRRALSKNLITKKSLFDCSKRLRLTSVLEKFWDLITVE